MRQAMQQTDQVPSPMSISHVVRRATMGSFQTNRRVVG
jgi:hypothetical protein